MSNFFQYLTGFREPSIETGIINGFVDDRNYRVNMHGRSVILKSAISQKLKIGDHVIINRIKYDKYIVGTFQRKKTKILQEEVVIDG